MKKILKCIAVMMSVLMVGVGTMFSTKAEETNVANKKVLVYSVNAQNGCCVIDPIELLKLIGKFNCILDGSSNIIICPSVDRTPENEGTAKPDTGSNEDQDPENGGTLEPGAGSNESQNTDTGNSGSQNSGAGSNGSQNSGAGSNGGQNSGAGSNGSQNSDVGSNGSQNSGAGSNGSQNSGSGSNGSQNSGTGSSGSQNSGAGSNGSQNSGAGSNGSQSVGNGSNGSQNSGSGSNGCQNSGSGSNGGQNSGSGSNGGQNSGSGSNGGQSSGSGSNGGQNSGSGNNGSQIPDNGGTANPGTSSVTQYEKRVAELVNEIRAENGLSPLTLSSELSAVARVKSQDMKDNQYFSHTSPVYGSPFDMLKSFGISYRTAGENIAMGYATPEAVVNAWMNSSGHRANILNASYTKIGIGHVVSGNYWTQLFIG